MKKHLAVLAAVSLAIALGSIPAHAEHGASIKDHGCTLIAADGSFFFAPMSAHTTVAQSGNSTITCKAPLPEGSEVPEKAVIMKDFWCWAGGHLTDKTHSVVTPSGESHLKCQYKANK